MSQSIENLAALWSSISSLCEGFDEEQWKTPTGCPGWSVQDNVSHLVDYESRAIGRAGPEHSVAESATSHIKNDIGRGNEVGIDFRRSWSGAEVLEEFREVTALRLEQLRALGPADLERPVDTPAGPGTLADMLTLRVMDTWSHEQDIRRAVGVPGGDSGPAADQAVAYFSQFLPFVVGKRAGAPEGSSVVFRVGDRAPVSVVVVDGRGSVARSAPDSPTVVLSMPAATFAALVGGRSDAPDDVEVSGDEERGRRVVAAMGFMP